MEPSIPTTDRAVIAAQTAYLDRVAPGHRSRRVRWSGGTTQLIELGDGPPLLLIHGGLGEAFQCEQQGKCTKRAHWLQRTTPLRGI